MYKLSLYLNDNQYEKLEVLQEHSRYDSPEEYVNELLYDALFSHWCKYKADGLKKLIDSGNYEEESIRIVVNETEYEIWSDGSNAVISCDDSEAFNIQMIEGKYHFVLENGTRIECSSEMSSLLSKVLSMTGIELQDLSKADIVEGFIAEVTK